MCDSSGGCPPIRKQYFSGKVTSVPAVLVFVAENINATSPPVRPFYTVKNEVSQQFRDETSTF